MARIKRSRPTHINDKDISSSSSSSSSFVAVIRSTPKQPRRKPRYKLKSGRLFVLDASITPIWNQIAMCLDLKTAVVLKHVCGNKIMIDIDKYIQKHITRCSIPLIPNQSFTAMLALSCKTGIDYSQRVPWYGTSFAFAGPVALIRRSLHLYPINPQIFNSWLHKIQQDNRGNVVQRTALLMECVFQNNIEPIKFLFQRVGWYIVYRTRILHEIYTKIYEYEARPKSQGRDSSIAQLQGIYDKISLGKTNTFID
jgi:hypothetical protein